VTDVPSRALQLVASRSEPDPGTRALSAADLRRLWKLGFHDLARRLAAGTCPKCGMNRLGVVHRDLCDVGEKAKKKDAQTIRQPWEPRAPGGA
jgi:hypothetical protein